MAKKVDVIVKQGLKHQGRYPEIGSQITLDAAEAKRLLGLGVVELPAADVEDAADKQTSAKELIAAIKAAQSLEELSALVPEDESRKSVVEAATARWQELEEQQQ